MEVELEDTKILWPGGVLYGGGETYENGITLRLPSLTSKPRVTLFPVGYPTYGPFITIANVHHQDLLRLQRTL